MDDCNFVPRVRVTLVQRPLDKATRTLRTRWRDWDDWHPSDKSLSILFLPWMYVTRYVYTCQIYKCQKKVADMKKSFAFHARFFQHFSMDKCSPSDPSLPQGVFCPSQRPVVSSVNWFSAIISTEHCQSVVPKPEIANTDQLALRAREMIDAMSLRQQICSRTI